ncbi:peptidoglycan D,D-transpeptidase FtsI family protein [Marinicellulosiphila megalodicopiae]|uniref:peptidoglycan D,D-transpeptidase FtsI family protein n=1 Tax=Marinicellulosiphila megalodicopiae TaxID=2724896 RepID=UPI003BB0ECF5
MNKIYVWRFYFVLIVLALLLGVMLARALDLQVLNKEFYIEQGLQRFERVEEFKVARGNIVDRNGEPLAVSTPVTTIWADPRELKLEDLPAISKLSGVPLSVLKNRYDPKKHFIYIARQLAPADADLLMSQKFSGVYSVNEFKRFYPAGEIISQLIGFTDINDHGQEGLELEYETHLSGHDGSKSILKTRKGDAIRDVKMIEEAQAGEDIQLTIDLQLQYIAYKELKKATTKLHAQSGSIVILNIENNEILAMANMPSFNPNDRATLEGIGLRNRVLTNQYEPGSVMKTFTLAAALESGKFNEQSIIDVKPMRISGRSTVLEDPRYYGEIDLETILAKSSNVGVTKIALELGDQPMWRKFYELGFGQSSGLGFPGEVTGYLPNHEKWQEVQLSSLSFGYGITVTPMQLAQATSVIANEGVKLPVKLLKNNQYLTSAPETVMTKNNAKILKNMMKQVVEKGTGSKAALNNYSVAGKTGTARKVSSEGYIDDQHTATFIGFAPVEEPKIVVVVVIDSPQGELYGGGAVAAPVFSSVMQQALPLLNVIPKEAI